MSRLQARWRYRSVTISSCSEGRGGRGELLSLANRERNSGPRFPTFSVAQIGTFSTSRHSEKRRAQAQPCHGSTRLLRMAKRIKSLKLAKFIFFIM